MKKSIPRNVRNETDVNKNTKNNMTTEQTMPVAAEVASETQIRAHLIKMLTTMDTLIFMKQVSEPLAIERFSQAAALFPHLSFMSLRHEP